MWVVTADEKTVVNLTGCESINLEKNDAGCFGVEVWFNGGNTFYTLAEFKHQQSAKDYMGKLVMALEGNRVLFGT